MKYICGAYTSDKKSFFEWQSNVKTWLPSNFQDSTVLLDNVCIAYYMNNDSKDNIRNNMLVDGWIEKTEIQISEVIKLSKVFSGEYSIYSYKNNELTLLTDYMGTCPIYYYIDGANLYFANKLPLLFLNCKVPFMINEKKCKEFCSFTYINHEVFFNNETFYKDIFTIPVASYLIFSNMQYEIKKYIKESTFFTKNTTDFNTIFETVANSIIADKTKMIGVTLSGGIDSSVVLACLKKVGYKNIEAFHLTFDDDSLNSIKDLHLVKELAELLNIPLTVIIGDDLCHFDFLNDDPVTEYDDISGPSLLGNSNFYKIIAERTKGRCEHIFGGDGGDMLFNGTKFYGDYLMRQGRFREAKDRSDYLSKNKYQGYIKYNLLPNIPIIKNIFYKYYFWNDSFAYPDLLYFNSNKREIRKQKKLIFKTLNESRFLKTWWQRFVYNFAFPPNSKRIFPSFYYHNFLLDYAIFNYAINETPNKHYDIYAGEPGSYIVSKQFLRNAYRTMLPTNIIDQEIKTNYADMFKKYFTNDIDCLIRCFSSNEIYMEEIGIIKRSKFLERLQVLKNQLNDQQALFSDDARYLTNIIKTELWAKVVLKGRESVLNLIKPKGAGTDDKKSKRN